MLYEVYIPSANDEENYDVTITVEADNWMTALKSGLERTGEGEDAARNVMCDIKSDNSIHVTDATTRRVFVLREIAGDAAEPSEPSTNDEPKAVEPAKPDATSETVTSDDVKSEDSWKRIGSSTHKAVDAKENAPRVLREEKAPAKDRPKVEVRRDDESVSENILEEVFLEINRIHDGDMSMEEVVNFVMDLALEKIPCESGAILFVDVNGLELYFATARGPKAHEVMDFRVPMGRGIVGFCAKEGVSLAISDAQNDPRFYRSISEAIGHKTESLCCAPVQHEGRVYGALELMNKNGSHYNSAEMNALTYMGRQLARYVQELIMAREKVE